MKKIYLKMYNSVNRVCKSIKYMYWVKKKDLIWAVFERYDSIEDIQRVIKS
mgnify:CR=1 FL=1